MLASRLSRRIVQNRIAALRHERALTLGALAERVGTTKAQIQKLERGHRRLSLDWMERIARGLNVRMSDLLPADQVACQHSPFENALLGVLAQLSEDDRIILVRIAQELLSTSRKKGQRKSQACSKLSSFVYGPTPPKLRPPRNHVHDWKRSGRIG
jgi:transcriptional regulator with XRE-family HTH domain